MSEPGCFDGMQWHSGYIGAHTVHTICTYCTCILVTNRRTRYRLYNVCISHMPQYPKAPNQLLLVAIAPLLGIRKNWQCTLFQVLGVALFNPKHICPMGEKTGPRLVVKWCRL